MGPPPLTGGLEAYIETEAANFTGPVAEPEAMASRSEIIRRNLNKNGDALGLNQGLGDTVRSTGALPLLWPRPLHAYGRLLTLHADAGQSLRASSVAFDLAAETCWNASKILSAANRALADDGPGRERLKGGSFYRATIGFLLSCQTEVGKVIDACELSSRIHPSAADFWARAVSCLPRQPVLLQAHPGPEAAESRCGAALQICRSTLDQYLAWLGGNPFYRQIAIEHDALPERQAASGGRPSAR